jgi:3-dehydroquinate dehydratase
MCNSPEDAGSMMDLADHAVNEGIRFAIMGMGVHGHITRVLAHEMGCELVYASLDEPSAVDQLDIRTLERIRELAGLG